MLKKNRKRWIKQEFFSKKMKKVMKSIEKSIKIYNFSKKKKKKIFFSKKATISISNLFRPNNQTGFFNPTHCQSILSTNQTKSIYYKIISIMKFSRELTHVFPSSHKNPNNELFTLYPFSINQQ
jgi:hypothetical protein